METPLVYISVIYKNYFVVGKWYDYHDGMKSNIEGMETIALCRSKKTAEIFYNDGDCK
jgi:hypothetical protein